MRPAILLPLLLWLTGCLPEPSPHHEPLDDALALEVRTALVDTIASIDPGSMPSERKLDWEAELLANFARDASPAFDAIREGRLEDARLQDLGRDLVARMAERGVEGMRPPLILSALLEREPPLEPGARLLLLGSLNRLASEAKLKLSKAELEFFGRPVPNLPDLE